MSGDQVTPESRSSDAVVHALNTSEGLSSPLAVVCFGSFYTSRSGSLKSKRQVISGLLRRVRSEFQVAAAEVGERDRWQIVASSRFVRQRGRRTPTRSSLGALRT